MPAAAIAGAVATVAGSAISASATKKATNKAVAAQTQTAADNNALQRETYAKNEAALSPYVQRGNQAGNAIMELLGFPPTQQPQQAGTNGVNALMLPQWQQQFGGYSQPGEPGGIYNAAMQSGLGQYAQQQQQPTTVQAQPSAMSAFDTYRNSSGYQFRQNEGLNALASNFRGRGVSQSGAADKALLKFGQDYGSNEFGKYLGYLGNQQGVGLSGASALAGVGQNFANSVSANNNSAADAISNAALLKGQNTANIYGTAANALGNIGGQLISSYGTNSLANGPISTGGWYGF